MIKTSRKSTQNFTKIDESHSITPEFDHFSSKISFKPVKNNQMKKRLIFIEDHNISSPQKKIQNSKNKFSTFRKSVIMSKDIYKLPSREQGVVKSSLNNYNRKIERNWSNYVN